MGLSVPEGFCAVYFTSQILGGREAVFALGYELIDPTPVDLEAAFTAFDTFGGAVGWPADVSITSVRTETGTADPSEPIVEEWIGNGAGSGSNDLCPPNTAFLIRKVTAAGGRKNRGRAFVPWVQEALCEDSGILTSGTPAAITDAFTDLSAAVGTALEVVGPVLFHSNPVDAPTPITSYACQSLVATQRRRLRG